MVPHPGATSPRLLCIQVWLYGQVSTAERNWKWYMSLHSSTHLSSCQHLLLFSWRLCLHFAQPPNSSRLKVPINSSKQVIGIMDINPSSSALKWDNSELCIYFIPGPRVSPARLSFGCPQWCLAWKHAAYSLPFLPCPLPAFISL